MIGRGTMTTGMVFMISLCLCNTPGVSAFRISRQTAIATPISHRDGGSNALEILSKQTHASLFDIRGGAKDIELEDGEEDAGLIVTKLRNLVRSVLSISDRKSPAISNLFKSLIVSPLELLFGTRLLPEKKVKSKKKLASKSKKSKKSASKKSTNSKPENSEEAEKSDAETTAEAEKTDDANSETKTKKPKKKKAPKISKAAQKHLDTKLSAKSSNFRIQTELKDFIKSPPPDLKVKVGSNIRIWIVTITGTEGSIYEGESFDLRIQFPDSYPAMPPSVYFLPRKIPTHEHVYTNGDICLSLLGNGWRPNMTAQSIAISIQSMLNSATSKKLPMDNAKHALNKPGQYQKGWVYHDDNC